MESSVGAPPPCSGSSWALAWCVVSSYPGLFPGNRRRLPCPRQNFERSGINRRDVSFRTLRLKESSIDQPTLNSPASCPLDKQRPKRTPGRQYGHINHRIFTAAPDELIAAPADQPVVAETAVQDVVAHSANQNVVAGGSINRQRTANSA